jgi:alpha-glucosidase
MRGATQSRNCMLVLILAGMMGAPGFGTVRFVGNVTNTTVGKDLVDFTLDSGAVARVQMLAPDLVRVRVNPTGVLSQVLSGAISMSNMTAPNTQIVDAGTVVYLRTSQMLAVIQKAPFKTAMVRSDNSLIVADSDNPVGWDTGTGLIFASKYAPPDEHYFGLGLLGGPIDRRGRALVMNNQDSAGYGEFTYPLYSSYPYYFGLRGGKAYGVFLDNPVTPFFDMDSRYVGNLVFGAAQGEIDYYVMAGPTPSGVASTYAKLTGYAPLPPKWTLGYQQSGFGYKSEDQILSTAQTFRQLQIPCDALYFDLFYEDKLQMFSWDPVAYPTPQVMNQKLANIGFERVAIFDSAMLYTDPLWSPFANLGYFVTDSNGAPLAANLFLGQVSFLDLTRSDVRGEYEYLLGNFMQTGINAVWNDLDEPAANYIPYATYNFDGHPRTDQQARNIFALNQARASYEAQQQWRPTIRPWVLTAPGYSGSQRYSAGFSGDTLSTFDSLRVSVEISQHMGLSGQVQFGHDIGGFLGTPSPELYIRWLEFASYTTFFRTHSVDLISPRQPWTYGEPYTSMAQGIIRQHYYILPYLYTLMQQSSQTGSAVLAPLFYYFPSDVQTYSQDQEYMLGPSLLVAPVVQQGATSRMVYLPAGTNWIDYYSETNYAGGQVVSVNAPIDRIPLFARAGSIIPAGPDIQYVTDNSVAPEAVADIYPGANSTFTLYEDDGISMNYVSGNSLQTSISKTTTSNGTKIQIRRRMGTWSPPARKWMLQVHTYPAGPSLVQLNGVALPQATSETALQSLTSGWFYRGTDQRLIIGFPDDPNPLSVSIQN